MTTANSTHSVSRRTALAGLGAGGLGVALAATTRRVSALDQDLANHAQLGVWLILDAPSGPSTVAFFDDGTVVFGTQATQATPQGGVFVSAQLGVWESTGPNGTHFTAIQLLSTGEGAPAGSVTVDAYQTVSADGQNFASDPETVVTIRDAAYNIVRVIGPNAGNVVTGVKMGVGAPGFPEGTPVAGTPTS